MKGNSPRTASAFRQYVQELCIVGTGTNKWNRCYNKRQLEKHNSYRTIHGTASTGFFQDVAAAKAIQSLLDAGNSMQSATDRPAAFRECAQNHFSATDAYRVLTTAEASNAWAGGRKNYNFPDGAAEPDSNAAKAAQAKANAHKFTQMVWKGAAGKKVGFGIKDTNVYAWYCPTGNSPMTKTAFQENVCEAGCPKWCVEETVNKCYNNK
jgi:hypothetical protein